MWRCDEMDGCFTFIYVGVVDLSFTLFYVLLCIMKIAKCSKKTLFINSHQHLLK